VNAPEPYIPLVDLVKANTWCMFTQQRFYPHVPSYARRIAVRWAKSRGLEMKSAFNFPKHDFIHARLGLGTDCEGIVLAVEHLLQWPHCQEVWTSKQKLSCATTSPTRELSKHFNEFRPSYRRWRPGK